MVRPATIIVAGEAVIDLVRLGGRDYTAVPGGSPANVAVGLARQGDPVELMVRIGSGPLGRTLRQHATDNGVGLALAVDAAEPPTLAVVSLDDSGHADYIFYAEHTSDWAWTPAEIEAGFGAEAGTAPLAVVTGSIAIARPPGAAVLEAGLRGLSAATAVILDPNLRPALLAGVEEERARWSRLVTLADVIKVSDEDLAWLHPGVDPLRVAADWAASGPALVVLTRGSAGASAVTAAGVTTHVQALPTQVVDTVGAGDAFTAGLVHALAGADLLGEGARARLAVLSPTELAPLLRHAAATAALTCARRGADPPSAEQVARLLS